MQKRTFKPMEKSKRDSLPEMLVSPPMEVAEAAVRIIQNMEAQEKEAKKQAKK